MPLFDGLDAMAAEASARRAAADCREYRREAAGRIGAARVATSHGDCMGAAIALREARVVITKGVAATCPAGVAPLRRAVADMERRSRRTCGRR